MNKLKVLISGASIAGPALAYWLSQYGFKVTIVEKGKEIRGGGYPIDVRGTAIDVVEKMGILPQLQAHHIASQKITFLAPDGSIVKEIKPEELTGAEVGKDIEIPRGNLTELLFELTKKQQFIHYQFNDSIASIEDYDTFVGVTFDSGKQEQFDIVIGADGLHSNTRKLVFDTEEQFNHYLGYCFNGFTIPNYLGLSHEAITYALPGKQAVLSAPGDTDTLNAFLSFSSNEMPFLEKQDKEKQRALIAQVFNDKTWEIPRLVQEMLQSEDLYYDVVSQIRMPEWHRGHVALVGDSSFAPSFLSGQGSSLALVGAYILAGELASKNNHTDAFTNYERIMRPFVEANQSLAGQGATIMKPETEEELKTRNQMLSSIESSNQNIMPGDDSQFIHNSLQLPDYG